MYIEKVLDLWVQLMKKWGQKKCSVYNFVQCIYIYMCVCVGPYEIRLIFSQIEFFTFKIS